MAKAEKVKKEKKGNKEKEEKADVPRTTKKRKNDDTADVNVEDKPKEKKSKKTKAVLAAVAPDEQPHASAETRAADDKAKVDPALMLDKFALSEKVKAILRQQGINSLFPIQSQTFPHGLAGLDVVGRARTGCGKTLGFSLPLIERLMKDQEAGLNVGKGLARTPSAIIMAPTRELAKQIHDVLSQIGKACTGLVVLTVYGGTPYESQESALRKGVDVVVGTPGRIKDLMQRGRLKLNAIRYRILDEVDRMMVMGFIEDVETILKADEGQQGQIQTMLFSATMPKWIKDLCSRFLKKDHKMVDLIGDDQFTQASATTVRHMMLPCHFTQRPQLVNDLIRSWGLGGRTIVFTDTKSDANDLAASLSDGGIAARCLHGDMPQTAREVALAGFKEGKYNTLVATDVAARGLDIASVELVIQMDAPAGEDDME